MKSKPKPGKKAKKTAARAPRRARHEEIELDDEVDQEEELELDDVDELELEHAAAELGASGGGRVYVTKLEPKDQAGVCDPYSTADYTVEQLRADWGDGRYSIVIRRAGGEIYMRGIVQLAKRVQRQVLTPVIDAAQIRREAREELQASVSPMVDMMKQAFSALAGRPAPATDPIEAIIKLQRLTDRGDGGHKSFLEGIQFAKELVGPGGNAGVADVAMKFLDKLSFDPTPAPPASSAPGAAAPAQRSREEVMQIVKRAIAQRIPILLRGALQGTEASVYAQLVLDQLPDAYLSIVAEQLKRADWWEQLVAIAPDVGPHQAWFTTLRDEVLREIETPPAPSG